MTAGGAFTPAARAAVHTAFDGRCAGCGTTSPLTIQHRIARGMGGTSRSELGAAVNGILLCGSGTTGCHGWTEHNPVHAGLLGWRLPHWGDPEDEPFWTNGGGWRAWVLEDGVPLTVYVDEGDLSNRAVRLGAVWQVLRVVAGTPTTC